MSKILPKNSNRRIYIPVLDNLVAYSNSLVMRFDKRISKRMVEFGILSGIETFHKTEARISIRLSMY